MIWSIAQEASPAANSLPAVNRPRTWGHVEIGDPSRGPGGDAVTLPIVACATPATNAGQAATENCCDQFRPWLYLYNYKASYFSL